MDCHNFQYFDVLLTLNPLNPLLTPKKCHFWNFEGPKITQKWFFSYFSYWIMSPHVWDTFIHLKAHRLFNIKGTWTPSSHFEPKKWSFLAFSQPRNCQKRSFSYCFLQNHVTICMRHLHVQIFIVSKNLEIRCCSYGSII